MSGMTQQVSPQRVRSYSYVRERAGKHEFVYWRSGHSTPSQKSRSGRRGRRGASRHNMSDVLTSIAALLGLVVWLWGSSRDWWGMP